MIEFFDVVNQDDQIIDRKPRNLVHAKGLFHRAVHALVINSEGSIYIQKRSMNKDVNPGLWDCSMSGHVTSGESYNQALYREIQEELGITLIELPDRLFKLFPCEQTGNEFSWVYHLVFDGKINPCKKEIEIGTWVMMDELEQWIQASPSHFTSSFSIILALYFTHIKRLS